MLFCFVEAKQPFIRYCCGYLSVTPTMAALFWDKADVPRAARQEDGMHAPCYTLARELMSLGVPCLRSYMKNWITTITTELKGSLLLTLALNHLILTCC